MYQVGWNEIKLSLFTGCLLCLLTNPGNAQKHDFIWMNGYDAEYGGKFGNFYMDFHTDPISVVPIDFQSVDLRTQVSTFCSADGDLLLVSNGCRFFDRYGNVLPGGDTLNPGKYYNDFCADGEGYYPVTFGMFLLPLGMDSVMAFHLGLKLSNQFGLTLSPLYLSLIDVGDESLQLIFANKFIGQFNGEPGIACLHGNGRDWWLVFPETSSTTYYRYLIGPKVEAVGQTQDIGFLYDYNDCPAPGIQSISPDGRFFVRYNNYCGLSFFDFDRCTGMLSNERRIILPEVFSPGAFTVFSPNSRYCYYNSSRVIMQVDMWDAVLTSDTVAIVDSFPADFGSGFFAMQRAPDGRIYISTGSSNMAWHVIEYPDVKGKDCWVHPSGMLFPHLTSSAIPHIPNYRLGPLEGSPCDTLGGPSVVEPSPGLEEVFRLYPNPARGHAHLELDAYLQHSETLQVRLVHMSGTEMYTGRIPPYAFLHTLPLERVGAGMYLVEIMDLTGKRLGMQKLVVE
ncbi:MAG: T9SS type A sorting domain-containing protein [Saprospiraceae bacterium]|nr:T9SS type A sorting domain-containing protein [Saprospiraceae bacterium]